jgi:transcriptional regulator with XRE-family HTH domain
MKGNEMQKQLFQERENNFYQKLGRGLKLERIGQGFTQSDVGKAINVSFQQIQKYEKGINRADVFKMLEIMNFFKKDYKQFLEEYNVYTNRTEN